MEKQIEFTFEIENTNSYKSKAILFGGAVFPTLEQENGVTAIVREYSHDQIRMSSVHSPYYIEGFTYEILKGEMSQFSNKFVFWFKNSINSGSWESIRPITYVTELFKNEKILELPTYSFPVTGNHYLEIELNANTKVLISFKKK